MSESYVNFQAGQFIFREGQAGDDMFIIAEGRVEILRQERGGEPIAVLECGDFFGEMAILEDQPRFASARARSACRLLKIDRAGFGELVRDNFEIAIRIMRKLAARLRSTEQALQQVASDRAQLKHRAIVGSELVQAPLRTPAPRLPPTARPKMKLVHLDSGTVFGILGSLPELVVGRQDPVTGATPEIDLGPLDSKRTLSRRHAKIINEGGMTFVREEVGASNGTFLNEQRLKTGLSAPLHPSDRLRFGNVELLVQAA